MVKIELGKRDFIWIGLIVVLLGVGVVYAFGGSEPAVMGHDAGELGGTCLSDGTNCDVTRAWVNNRVASVSTSLGQSTCQWIYVSTCGHSCGAGAYYQAVCPVGYYMAGHSMYTWASYATYNHRIYCCR
ncbi:hypothetical protein K8R30_03135 [archaeon]|nr:hypothetical protein [archaeon]